VDVVAYRFEIALERIRESVLPECDLIGEFCLGDLESLGGNVDVLETKFVRKVDKGQRNECTIKALRRRCVRHGPEAESIGTYRRNSS